MRLPITIGIVFLFGVVGVSVAQPHVLDQLIAAHQAEWGPWATDPASFEIEVLYTQIDRDAHNQPSFTTYRWGRAPGEYFYPASTVKMPAAFVALEKINDLGIIGLDKHTPLRHGAGRAPQTPAVTDATAANLLPSVGHYVRKIFLASDNDAYNRLYELLGQRAFNDALHHKGYTDTRLIHRLAVSGFDTLGNRYTNPIEFYRADTLLYRQAEVYSQAEVRLALTEEQRGQGYLNQADELVREPFDFRYKNYVSIQNLHDMLQAVLFPQAVPPQARFRLTPDDYRFLYRAMAERPRESDFPHYDHEPDNYVKFWMYGDRDSSFQIPDHIRIFNKVGWAYGYLTDVAYIVDLARGVEFMLVGTIHVNANQIYNDGEYEYESVGLPFFGQLGRAVYAYECTRPRNHRPDFTWLGWGAETVQPK